jgi:hypothetical protein
MPMFELEISNALGIGLRFESFCAVDLWNSGRERAVADFLVTRTCRIRAGEDARKGLVFGFVQAMLSVNKNLINWFF